MTVVLVLGLIAAGIYTGSIGFYFAAGACGLFLAVVYLLTLGQIHTTFKEIDEHFPDTERVRLWERKR